MAQAGYMLSLAGLVITLGCASVETGGRGESRGSSGVVTWEVSDIGRVLSSDNQRIRWSYLITLRNTSDRVIQLERAERATITRHSEVVGGTPTSQPFGRTLGARSELRIPTADNWGWLPGANTAFGGAATLDSITAFRRFTGADDRGAPIDIQVRVRLDPSVGLLARPPTPPRSLPPPKTLEASDFATLVGVWRGSYRLDGTLLDVPIEVTILADGTFQIAENEPVTNRFRRTVQVKDGGLDLSGDRDRGTLTLHEIGSRRMLAGRVSQPGGQPGTTSSTLEYAIYLEAQAPKSASPSPAIEALPTKSTASLPPAILRAFETYKSDPKYTHFKAFAVDPASGAWGRAWGLPSAAAAMDRARYECGKRGAGCEVYAVGDAVLEGVPPEQRDTMVLGGLHLTYRGILTIEQDGRVETSSGSFYLFRGITEITGSWSSEDSRVSGMITGGVSDTNRAVVKMTQMQPCRVEFTGAVSIGAGGKTLDASYTGPACDGAPLKATFTGARQ